MKKYNETMIIRNGKLIYAITLDEKSENTLGRENCSYIYINDGKVHFTDGWIELHRFNFAEESHRLAKEIFITELQTDIKRRILELKQLQTVFDDLNLSECFGSVLADNTKLLIEVRDQVQQVSVAVQNTATVDDVATVIQESVTPIALTKKGRKKKEPAPKEEREEIKTAQSEQ